MTSERETERSHKFRIDAEHEAKFQESNKISPEQLRGIEMFAEDLQLKLQEIYPKTSVMENVWRAMSAYFSGIINDVVEDYREKFANWEVDHVTKGGIMYNKAITLILIIWVVLWASMVQAYTDNEIVNAIYKAEGGVKAKKPFGILSVECNDYQECKRICANTVRNNRKRYADWGHKKFKTFLEFLSSRYAPIGANNDPKGLNSNWLRNVLYFLNR